MSSIFNSLLRIPSNCLVFTGDSSFTTISVAGGANIEFSKDLYSWTSGTSYSEFSGKVYMRAKTGSTPIYGITGSYTKVSGNIMSLVDYTNLSVSLNDSQFFGSSTGLFEGVTTLTDASGLSLASKTIASGAYRHMFRNCSALTTAPDLSAVESVGEYACYSMFIGTAITSAPWFSSSVTSIPTYACHQMFMRCSSLTTAPDMSHITSVGKYGCSNMFAGTSSTVLGAQFVTGPDLSNVTSVGESAFNTMFAYCTAMTTAPNLSKITTLSTSSCEQMFGRCAALTGPVYVPNCATSSAYTDKMFTNAGTATGAGGKIVAPTSTSTWNSTSAGISSTYWTVSAS